jgi:hypothetical protein
MKNSGPGPRKLIVLASVFLGTMYFVACDQSKPTPASPAARSQLSGEQAAFVVFEGPWAFAPDPNDANSVVAIAPKSNGHRDLYVKSSNQSSLYAGAYILSLPAHSGGAAATADPNIAQSTISARNLQHALDSKSARYAVRLPKPEEYLVVARSKSRIGATYPPDVSTEKDYADAVSLRYNVSTLSGFSLSGTPDTGSFNPLLLQVDTPMIRFVIEASQDDDPLDKCDTHSRASFHDLTTLLGLTLYVDFPDNPDTCHGSDPQNNRPAKAESGVPSSRQRLAALLEGNLIDMPVAESASIANPIAKIEFMHWSVSRQIGSRLALAALFNRPANDCHSPDLILTLAP